jgi:hypothetical protein
MCRQINRDSHTEFTRLLDIQKIFYVSIDPDTTFTKDTLEQFERKSAEHTEAAGICPLLSTGFYKYDVESYTQGIPLKDGAIDWAQYITEIESEAGAALKEQLSREPLAYTKHPLTDRNFLTCSVDEIADSLEEAQNLVNWLLAKCAILPASGRRLADGLLKARLKKFEGEFQSFKRNPGASRAFVSQFHTWINQLKTNPALIDADRSMHIEKFKEALAKINQVKTISFTDLLYPTEPVMFVSLYQKDILDFSSLLQDESKPFGSVAGTMEGPKLVIKLKQLWKQQLSLKTQAQQAAAKASKQRLQARGFYSSMDFSYTTATPQRNKDAATASVQRSQRRLPRTTKDLSQKLKEHKDDFHQTLESVLGGQPQSVFGRSFSDMIESRITLAIDRDEKQRFSLATQECLPSQRAIDDLLTRTRQTARDEIIQSLLEAMQPR